MTYWLFGAVSLADCQLLKCEIKKNYASAGRDHGLRGFTLWMAGGGIKPGVSYGSTDEVGYVLQETRCYCRLARYHIASIRFAPPRVVFPPQRPQ